MFMLQLCRIKHVAINNGRNVAVKISHDRSFLNCVQFNVIIVQKCFLLLIAWPIYSGMYKPGCYEVDEAGVFHVRELKNSVSWMGIHAFVKLWYMQYVHIASLLSWVHLLAMRFTSASCVSWDIIYIFLFISYPYVWLFFESPWLICVWSDGCANPFLVTFPLSIRPQYPG